MIFLIWFLLVGELSETEALISVTGLVGKEVTITCSHANAFYKVKYFCKGKCGYEDVLIRSDEKTSSNSKYSITDKGNTFVVTVSHLTKQDAGMYWCAIERNGVDTYNEVVLTVIEGNVHNPENDKKLLYIKAGLGSVVFALVMMVVVMFLRHRRRHTRAASGHGLHATLSNQKEDVLHSSTCSSSAGGETDGQIESIYQQQDTSKVHTDNIYSNTSGSSEAQIQSDALLYATICVKKPAECHSVTTDTELITYSTTTNTSTEESTLCSEV